MNFRIQLANGDIVADEEHIWKDYDTPETLDKLSKDLDNIQIKKDPLHQQQQDKQDLLFRLTLLKKVEHELKPPELGFFWVSFGIPSGLFYTILMAHYFLNFPGLRKKENCIG